MSNEVKLLSQPTNYAVVHLPGRKFPGVVFQGDSLNNLIVDLAHVLARLDRGDVKDASEELSYVFDNLKDVQKAYISTMRSQGIELPYVAGE